MWGLPRANMARRANMAPLNFVLISLLYWGLKWNFLLEWSSKTSIDGGCVFSTTNLTGSSCFSRKFSTQPYTGSRANGATTTEFKLPRRGKYFKSKTSYYPNSAPLFQFNDFCFLATLNLIQGCQRIIVINQADHEDDAKLLVTSRSHIWIFVRLRTGNILFWPRKLSFLTKSTFLQSLSHGLIALFPMLKLNFLGTSYIDSTA